MAIDPTRALANVLEMLQTDPAAYKLFGIYWWPVKALLRRVYDRDRLYLLGSYQDPVTAALVPGGMGLQATLQAAFAEYGRNARFGRAGGVVEDPDGDLVTIYDEDAGL